MNRTGPPPSTSVRSWQLIDILRLLPERELTNLARRLRIPVDPKKRISVPVQVARALVSRPEARDPYLLPVATRELFFRLVEAGGSLVCPELPPAVEPLVARGIAFARGADEGGVELILPAAYLLQLERQHGEDPRGLRALLRRTQSDVGLNIASYYQGRQATQPLSLALEAAWQCLNDPEFLRQELGSLSPLERKLLSAVEAVGGEVDTAELLELEREPMRLRGAQGATPSRRGVGFALERRGFLIPIHPDRHVIPTQVARIVGQARREEREAERHRIRELVLSQDHAPARARFAEDPVPLAVALALTVREQNVEIRSDVGTPRSLIQRFAARFGQDAARVQLIASLSRAVGLWDESVAVDRCPPGNLRLDELGEKLFQAWNLGGVWDESAPEGELLRFAPEARDSSPGGAIRGLVLDALAELGDGHWVPWLAIANYVQNDPRAPGFRRLTERWANRFDFEVLEPTELAWRIVVDSLHALGMVDVGEAEEEASDAGATVGPTIRLTPLGRRWLGLGDASSKRDDKSQFLGHQSLRLGGSATVAQVFGLMPFVEVGGVSGALDVTVTPTTVSRALATGVRPELVREALGALATLPDPIARTLTQASTVVGRGEFVICDGFLWVDDPAVRDMLRTRRRTADLFVDPSPPGGLLVAPGIELDRLVVRCRGLGVEVMSDGRVYHARSATPSPRRRVTPPPDSGLRVRGGKSGTHSVGRSGRSSGNLPAARKR